MSWRSVEARVIESWGARVPLSEHLRLEVAAASRLGRPLEPGVPVAGCGCATCTGLPADHVARVVARRPRRGPGLNLDAARSVPVAEVARRLGMTLDRQGRALCPFHNDTNPSLHVNAKKGRAFCNACGRSWDGIALYRESKGISFAEAVLELGGAA